MSSSCTQRRLRGTGIGAFTLIELLVVVAIVAVLASLAISALQHSQVVARQAACASNMRQIGVALLAFATDNQSRFPLTTHTSEGVEDAWIAQLSSYVENVDRIRVSPAESPQRIQDILKRRGTSYILNDLVFGVTDEQRLLASLALPGRTILAFIGSESRRPGPMNDHTHAASWSSWSAMFGDVEVDRHRAGSRSVLRTKGGANYLYADGHVEFHRASEMKTRIDRGENPAKVPLTP